MKLLHKIRCLFNPHLAAGHKAEQAFEKLCEQNGYAWEKISQDKQSFRRYAALTKYAKRGDYLIRNNNVEVEVKCLKVYGNKTPYQYLAWKDLKRHKQMEDFTRSRVVFAFFEKNGRKVREDSVRMIPLAELMPAQNRKFGIFYDEKNKSLRIPRHVMHSGFELFKHF